MATTLEIDHKEMHDIKSAAELTGYSRDHVATLARGGKIVAAQIARQWYIDLDSLKQYAQITALESEVKQKHLSHERRSVKEFKDALKKHKTTKSTHRAKYEKNLHKSLASFLLFFGLMGGMLGFFAPELLTLTDAQIASLRGISSTPADEGRSFEAESFDGTRTVFGDGSVTIEVLADELEAIVLLPESIADKADMFSDPVEFRETEAGVELLLAGEQERAIGAVVVPISEVPVP